jgi:hypothetical protein
MPRVWNRDRFPPSGKLTVKMAEGGLPLAPTAESVSNMLGAMSKDREGVSDIVKQEIDSLLRWGAETCGMSFFDPSANVRRKCQHPKNLRASFLQDDGLANLKRIHWIFHELPETLHRDVLMHRMSHMDVVTTKVMQQMNVVWGVKRAGEDDPRRTNCIEKIYCRVLNEKKTTVVNPEKTRNGRIPFVRHPKTKMKSGNPAGYQKNKKEFYWKGRNEGEKVVSR